MCFKYNYDRINHGKPTTAGGVQILITVVQIVHVIFSLGLIVTVLMQSGKSAGLSGSIAGGAESFFGKKKSMDELLGKLTSAFAVLFIVTSVVLAIL